MLLIPDTAHSAKPQICCSGIADSGMAAIVNTNEQFTN